MFYKKDELEKGKFNNLDELYQSVMALNWWTLDSNKDEALKQIDSTLTDMGTFNNPLITQTELERAKMGAYKLNNGLTSQTWDFLRTKLTILTVLNFIKENVG